MAWEVKDDPEKGFKYLYLSPDEYQDLTARGQEHIVETQLIQDDGESRYMITSIIGLSDDIGVENLSAAGMIAGETSQAYDEVSFFLSKIHKLSEFQIFFFIIIKIFVFLKIRL